MYSLSAGGLTIIAAVHVALNLSAYGDPEPHGARGASWLQPETRGRSRKFLDVMTFRHKISETISRRRRFGELKIDSVHQALSRILRYLLNAKS